MTSLLKLSTLSPNSSLLILIKFSVPNTYYNHLNLLLPGEIEHRCAVTVGMDVITAGQHQHCQRRWRRLGR